MTISTELSHLFISMTKAQLARFIERSIDFSITLMNVTALVESIISITFFYFIESAIASASQSDLKSLNTIILHRFHFAVYSELTHDHKFSTTFVSSILSLKSMKQLNIASFISTSTFKSTSTTIKFSQHSISK